MHKSFCPQSVPLFASPSGMPKVSVDKFIDLTRRSGLVEHDQLAGCLARLENDSGAPLDDPQRLAENLISVGLITAWQAEKLLEGKHKGFFLGKYKLLGHLGTGGMSSVYLAEHVHMHRRVAIKVLPQSRIEDSSYLERFYREAKAAAALSHPNIVVAYDIDSQDRIHYLVMEYVEGRDLQTLVRDKGPVDYEAAANYIAQAANGLAHAHAAGLIHRDIKPANLLVDKSGVVKLLDLGLALFSDEKQASVTLAHEENVLGTADYLAPEQAVNSHSVDARADVYSLGCTFYFLLTGHAPFTEGSLAQRLMAHQKKAPPSIFKDRPDAPRELVEICQQMMAKAPHRRIQTATKVRELLAAWLATRGRSTDPSAPESSARLAVGAATDAAAGTVGQRPDARNAARGEVRRRQRDPALRDTAPGTGPTIKTSTGRNDAGPRKKLPVAQSLDSPDSAFSDFAFDVKTFNPSSGTQKPSILEQRRQRQGGEMPLWLWITVGLGAALFFVGLIALLAKFLG